MSGCKKFWADLLSLSMPIANCHLIVHLYTAGLYWQCHGACWCTWLCFVFCICVSNCGKKVVKQGDLTRGGHGTTVGWIRLDGKLGLSSILLLLLQLLLLLLLLLHPPPPPSLSGSWLLCHQVILIFYLCSIYYLFIYISILLHLKGIISKNWTCLVLAGWILCVNVAHNSSLQSLDEKHVKPRLGVSTLT